MEYVCTGAVLKCTMGTSTTKLKATPKNVSLVGKDQANIADFVSMVNVPSFGRCRSLAYLPTAAATAANHGRLTPMPCVPGTCPFWTAVDRNSLVCGQPALLKAAKLSCTFGGIISIVSPGQNKEVKAGGSVSNQNCNDEGLDKKRQQELLAELEDAPQNGEIPDKFDKDEFLDNLQDFLGILGFVPVAGALADLANAAISVSRGKWVSAGFHILSAVPGVGDAVAGAKIAYRVTKVKTVGNVAKNTFKAAKRIEGKAGYSRVIYDGLIDSAQTKHEVYSSVGIGKIAGSEFMPSHSACESFDNLSHNQEPLSEGVSTGFASSNISEVAPIASYANSPDKERLHQMREIAVDREVEYYTNDETLRNTYNDILMTTRPNLNSNPSVADVLEGLETSAALITIIADHDVRCITNGRYESVCADAYIRISDVSVKGNKCNVKYSIVGWNHDVAKIEAAEAGLMLLEIPTSKLKDARRYCSELYVGQEMYEDRSLKKGARNAVGAEIVALEKDVSYLDFTAEFEMKSGNSYLIRAFLGPDIYKANHTHSQVIRVDY